MRNPARLCLILLVLMTMSAMSAFAQPFLYEVEPNDTPAEATDISGEVVLVGSMEGQDQDAYNWTVSDVDAQKRWTIELHGVPGRLTVVEVIRVQYAENGVDVTGIERLFKMGTRDGSKPSIHEDLIFDPGEYTLGVAGAGGGGGGIYRPPTASLSFGGESPADTATATEPGGYRLAIREGSPLTLKKSPKDRSTRENAYGLRLGRESAAYLDSSDAWYKFEIADEDAARRWDIEGQIPVGRNARVTLRDSDGSELSRTSAEKKGKFSFRDLGLEAGSYTIEVASQESGFIQAVTPISVGQRIEGAEAEPNDDWKLANRADFTQPVTGRMGRKAESDYFQFSLDEESSDKVLSLHLVTSDDSEFRICLLNGKATRLQCRTGSDAIELAGLVLTPGEWGFVVERGPEAASYTVKLESTGPIQAGFETEPNDTQGFASAIPSNNRIKGTLSKGDTDFFKVFVTDEAQLWRIQVLGDGVHEVAFEGAAGIQKQTYRAASGQRRIRLDNVFLLPGTHSIRVSGKADGSYTLLARPLGPPDPNGEFEPNDDASRMQMLRIGQTRTGLLEDKADRDLYRFYLANWDHIRLEIAPPADGAIDAYLYWYGNTMRQWAGPEKGKPVVLQGLFPPGDYHIALKAIQVSEAEYSMSLERLERYSCPADCEPNDDLAFARPLPARFPVEGKTGEWKDRDWYSLPKFEAATEVTISLPEKREMILVTDLARTTKSLIEWDSELGAYRGTIPANTTTFLRVTSNRRAPDYGFEVAFAGQAARLSQPSDTAVELSIDLETHEVGAYRRYGQRVGGELQILNSGASPVNLDLETTASDLWWQVNLDQSDVTVPPGGATVIPMQIEVPADAWADTPVRVSVRARDRNGSQATTSTDIIAGRATPPINPRRAWTLPEPLLGGFNVAAEALGGKRITEGEQKNNGNIPGIGAGFQYLYDGMAPDGHYLALRSGHDLHTATVELAGEEAVEVVGTVLNLLGAEHIDQFVKDFALQLSLDGEGFETVAEGTLVPLRREQSLILDTPRQARYARLLLTSSWGGSSQPSLQLGEWKVIARPGTDLSGGKGFNLVSEELGGHVVWSRPQISAANWDRKILTPREENPNVRPDAGEDMEFVVGFQHNRTAQITRLEWVESSKVADYARTKSALVSVSLDSPVGPWLPVGEWKLPAGGGSGTLELDSPVWARFVKITAPGIEKFQWRSWPETLKIWERPTDAEYRSILTEWGFASQEAYYESTLGIEIDKPLLKAGHYSRAKAAPLEIGTLVGGQVQLGKHEHWYRLTIPGDENLVTFEMIGDPTVRTEMQLETEAGEPVILRKDLRNSTPGRHLFEAVVEPGSTVFLRVTEPPRNVAFLWDTSASVGSYLSLIYNSLIIYAEDLVPGLDAANYMPFGATRPLLADWYGEPYILQTVLNDYPRKENSSQAEGTLYWANRALAPRSGTKAIVVITDAATSRYGPVWEQFQEVQPRIFGLGVSSAGAFGRNPVLEQNLFQDWSRVNGGDYAQVLSAGEMEVAFDRVSTLLRRPADYTLVVNTSFREAPGPGFLSVVAKEGGGSAGGAVELILDASGSMLKRLDGKRRIVIAKEVLSEAVNEHIPAGTPVALRVFGHREPNSCRTDLEMALAPLDPAKAHATIQGVNAMNLAKTPIADSLAKVESDLKKAQGRKVVVLVTDGEETCEGDPEEVIQKLRDKGIDIALNIVSFAIDDALLEAQFQSWAELGGGRYFSAKTQEGLSDSLKEALQIPYTVYDSSGTLVTTGILGGEPQELEEGFYRVVIQSSPPQTFDRVEVPGEELVELELD